MTKPNSECRLRLLSLDGGGVRGLAELYMLRQVLAPLGNPKPCQFFHMIGGTSTGGLIAIMLARLELSVDECINLYLDLMNDVFQRSHSRVTVAVTGAFGRARAQYSSQVLERKIKQVIRSAGYAEDTPFRGPKKHAASIAKTFVVSIRELGRTQVALTDYTPSQRGEFSNFYNEMTIWEAARATSAATTFFDPIEVSHGGIKMRFIDGGLGANNPINHLVEQAMDEFGRPIEPQIRCILSLGTGVPPQGRFGTGIQEIANSIVKIATDTQETAKTFALRNAELVNRNAYVRFNPPDLFAEVKVDEIKHRDIIADRLDSYGQEDEVRRKIQIYRLAVEDETPVFFAPVSIRPPTKPRQFYDLSSTETHIGPNRDSYWRHLTLESWRIYEAVFVSATPDKGVVSFENYMVQFRSHDPPQSKLVAVWDRLQRLPYDDIRKTRLPKGLFMAVIYMLHIERFHPNKQPFDAKGEKKVMPERRELLKRFGNWVPCECDRGCGLEWNFANDVGLHRGGVPKKRCPVLECFTSGTFKLGLARSDPLEVLDKTKAAWGRSKFDQRPC